MTKSLKSYSEPLRRRIVDRRIVGNTRGSGYWAAQDYLLRKGTFTHENVAPIMADIDGPKKGKVRV